MSNKKRILIIVYNDLNSDPRVKKQIKTLKDEYEVISAGTSPANIDGVKFYPIRFTLNFSISRKLKRLFLFLFNKYDNYYWDESRLKFIDSIKTEKFDLIIANDIATLPLAFKLAQAHTKIYFDAHDYHPREFEDNRRWRFFHQDSIIHFCKKYIPQVNYFTTSSISFANEYKLNFGKEASVITNAADFANLEPSRVVEGEIIKFIHHGAAIPSRKIEIMIKVFQQLDENKYSLDLMLVGDKTYIKYLKGIIDDSKHINIIPPVTYQEITNFTNKYDVGLFLLPPVNFNYLYTLPNKMFEFVQARLAIVISPNTEMKRFVEEYQMGKVAKDYEINSMVNLIQSLTYKEIMTYKSKSHQIAYQVSSDANITKIKQQVKQLLS